MERNDDMSHEVSAASLQGDCSMERTSAMEDNNNEAATQAVQVAVNIRPLIAQERIQGCKDCLKVMPHEPQVVCFLEFLYCRGCLLVWDFLFRGKATRERFYKNMSVCTRRSWASGGGDDKNRLRHRRLMREFPRSLAGANRESLFHFWPRLWKHRRRHGTTVASNFWSLRCTACRWPVSWLQCNCAGLRTGMCAQYTTGQV